MLDKVNPHSLRNLILITVVIFGMALVVAGTAIWKLRAGAIADAARDSGNLATVFAEQTEQSVKAIDAALIELNEQIAVMYNAAPQSNSDILRSEEVHRQVVGISSRLPQSSVVMVVNSNGHVVNHSRGWPASDIDVSDRDYFAAHRATDIGMNVNVVVAGRVTGDNIVIFSRRIESSQGVFLGVTTVGVPIDFFRHIYGSIHSLTDQVFMLLRSDGTILVRYPDSTDRAGQKLPLRSPWYRVIAQGGRFYRTPGVFDGEPRLVAVRSVGDFPLFINVSASEAASLAAWWQTAELIASGTVLTLVCLALLLGTLAVQFRKAAAQAEQLRRREEELRVQNLRFKAAIDNMGEGLTMFDAEERMVVCNDQFGSIYSLPPNLLKVGTPYRSIVAYRVKAGVLAGDTSDAASAAKIEAANKLPKDVPNSRLEQLADGRLICIKRHPLDPGGWVATHEDVTDRHRQEARISFMAHHDLLTGLANRAFFAEKIEDAVARSRRYGEPFAILMLDLDKFKNVNDTLGHPAGDQLLRETAQRLKTALRETDVLARLGGDEFAIIQSSKDKPREDAASLADRIVNVISTPYDIDGNIISVGTSVGIALAPEDAVDGTDLLKMADLALYGAKSAGRNGFRFFDPTMLAEADHRRKLEDQLRIAISRGEFELHYQPVIDVKTRRQAGFEALVRWRDPARGLVMPDQFIPLAEDTGLIVPLGVWILQQACADAAKWPSHIKVAVNLSPVQLAQHDLLEVVLCALVESSLPPERLELEITETALFRKDVDCLKLMRQLQQRGITIAIDDFGTGYSSLNYLTMFPFDKIKIDPSFTTNLTRRADCAAIVSAVLALGHGLQIETVAEGVETEQQFDILRAAGVSFVQGYLFGRPCPASNIVLDDASAVPLVESAA
jgi:diguanylate cyclase (GGDEF)-like protein